MNGRASQTKIDAIRAPIEVEINRVTAALRAEITRLSAPFQAQSERLTEPLRQEIEATEREAAAVDQAAEVEALIQKIAPGLKGVGGVEFSRPFTSNPSWLWTKALDEIAFSLPVGPG